ncbi:MAG: hypothetical protein P8016_03300 [Sedimentisphaerales bacterium]
MPAHRRKQSNAMLYTLIIFVGLFIVATTVAVFYYVKAEEYRITGEDLQSKFNVFASEQEQSEPASLVGAMNPGSTYLGTMLERFDNAVSLIVGGIPQSTSAEVKINNAKNEAANARTQATDMLKLLEPSMGEMDPNRTGLVQVVDAVTQKLQSTVDSRDMLQKTLNDKLTEFQKTQQANLEAYQTLLTQKEELRRDYNDVAQDYAELSQLLRKTTDEQVQSLRDQVEREKTNSRTLNDELLESQAKLSEAQGMLADAKKQLATFGEPNRDSMAYSPDGRILSIDNNAKIAYINLGSNDCSLRPWRLYRTGRSGQSRD